MFSGFIFYTVYWEYSRRIFERFLRMLPNTIKQIYASIECFKILV